MSLEFITLTRHRPDIGVLPDLVSADLRVRGSCVFDPEARLLLRVEEPVLVSVPDEPQRLLDRAVETPVWWTELRTATNPPTAEKLAQQCADELASRYDGTVWSSR